MYYKASSVIAVLTNHPNLSIDDNNPVFPYPVPSCPKLNDHDGHCHYDFPKCEGEFVKCKQKLRLVNKSGHPVIVELFYYIDNQNRYGRIKKSNATLTMIKSRYGLNEDALEDL